ncbi:MAG: DEAD/DEAH box helicase [Pseudomonadota bacterium]|nr:DEAD/DEAH box helicase [Pseudomonadota bacterium]
MTTNTTLFSDLPLAQPLLRALEACQYTTPTPVQTQAIPVALEGRDLIATAQTGTGKTAAFVLPALQKIQIPRPKPGYGPRVLVLTPTRELALQVLEAVKKYSKFSRVFAGAIIGGASYFEQKKLLSRETHLIVGTPGRLIDQMNAGRLDLSCVEMLVLDEADRMLDMGFLDAVQEISDKCPAQRQTLMFTATMDAPMARLAGRLLKDPHRVDIAGTHKSHDTIDQRLLWASDLSHKHRLLDHLVSQPETGKAIIFTATKRDADRLADDLNEKGHAAAALHGDMKQNHRNRTVDRLRKGQVRYLVATDVAARGIDIRDVTHVINFDLPRVAEDYVHRIGRTGRAGASGTSWTFAGMSERGLLKAIERYTGKALTEHVIAGLEPRMPAPGSRDARKPAGQRPPFRKRAGEDYRRPEGRHPDGRRPEGRHPGDRKPEGKRFQAAGEGAAVAPFSRERKKHRPGGAAARPYGTRFQGKRRDGGRSAA